MPKDNGKHLVIVESPAKARTIGRLLGSDYVVLSSMGHVRDLPRKEMGVDVANSFTPTYVKVPGRESTLREIKKASKKSYKMISMH